MSLLLLRRNLPAARFFDRRADRARRGMTARPVDGNFVYELPFLSAPDRINGNFFGGCSLISFFDFSKRSPFTVTLGSDPTGSGNPIRPNLNTDLIFVSMTIREIFLAAGGANFFDSLPRGSG